MRTIVVVIVGVVAQQVVQVHRVPDQQVIETFAADGSDYALDMAVHPRRMRLDRSIAHAHRAHAAAEHQAVGAVVVAHQEARRLTPGKGFNNLPNATKNP